MDEDEEEDVAPTYEVGGTQVTTGRKLHDLWRPMPGEEHPYHWEEYDRLMNEESPYDTRPDLTDNYIVVRIDLWRRAGNTRSHGSVPGYGRYPNPRSLAGYGGTSAPIPDSRLPPRELLERRHDIFTNQLQDRAPIEALREADPQWDQHCHSAFFGEPYPPFGSSRGAEDEDNEERLIQMVDKAHQKTRSDNAGPTEGRPP